MVSSRKARAKSERTFLECVQDELKAITSEVIGLKSLIQSLLNDRVNFSEHPATNFFGNEENEQLCPPPPPRLDVYNRDYLLQYRNWRVESFNVDVPKLVSRELDHVELTNLDKGRNLDPETFSPFLQLPNVMLGSSLGEHVWYDGYGKEVVPTERYLLPKLVETETEASHLGPARSSICENWDDIAIRISNAQNIAFDRKEANLFQDLSHGLNPCATTSNNLELAKETDDTRKTQEEVEVVLSSNGPSQASPILSELCAALLIQHFWRKRLLTKRGNAGYGSKEIVSNLLPGEDPITYWHVIDETFLDVDFFTGPTQIEFHTSVMRALFDEPRISLSDHQAKRLMAAVTEPFNQMNLLITRGKQLQKSMSSMRTRGLKREYLLTKERNQSWSQR